MKRHGKDVPDHALWDEVARTITPLRTVRPVIPSISGKSRSASTVEHTPMFRDVLRPQHLEVPPPLAPFDRRTAQRLSRGQVEPDGRIDLHGHGVELARMKLYHFLEAQRRSGARMVLVITGKGASPFARHTLHGTSYFHSPEREGRLRREVPCWLDESVFREHVSGFQPSHPRHGGGGAYYVRLRRLPDHK